MDGIFFIVLSYYKQTKKNKVNLPWCQRHLFFSLVFGVSILSLPVCLSCTWQMWLYVLSVELFWTKKFSTIRESLQFLLITFGFIFLWFCQIQVWTLIDWALMWNLKMWSFLTLFPTPYSACGSHGETILVKEIFETKFLLDLSRNLKKPSGIHQKII